MDHRTIRRHRFLRGFSLLGTAAPEIGFATCRTSPTDLHFSSRVAVQSAALGFIEAGAAVAHARRGERRSRSGGWIGVSRHRPSGTEDLIDHPWEQRYADGLLLRPRLWRSRYSTRTVRFVLAASRLRSPA